MNMRIALAGITLLVVGVFVFFVDRTPRAEPVRLAEAEPSEDVASVDAELLAGVEDPAGTARQTPVAQAPARDESTAPRSNVLLRVIHEGIADEYARHASVTVTATSGGEERPRAKVQETWPCQGISTELDLGPFFARVADRMAELRDDALVVAVDHPQHFSEIVRVPVSSGVELPNGDVVYEVRVQFAEVFYWPVMTLAVRDANTREHLEDVELRCVPTAFMGRWQQPGTPPIFTSIGRDLSSPIAMRGGRKADESEDHAAGLALLSAPGERARPAELVQPEENARGIVVYARSPGYAWGQIVLDLSLGTTREVLLEPEAVLDVRFTNVQRERYATLGEHGMLGVTRTAPDGSQAGVLYRTLDATLEAEGLRIEGLVPGEYVISVELGDLFPWRKRPVLAREELSLATGEVRELLLALADAPAPPELASLGGVLSFPAFDGEASVRLQFFGEDYGYGDADFDLPLADMEPVGGELPTWAFQVDELPVGFYQVRLLPFEKNWIVELPAGGRDDVELVLPELAEVHVETVDARTGDRIPLEMIRYGYREDLPGRVHHEWNSFRTTTRFVGEPGRFRFWTAPGTAYVGTYAIPSELNIALQTQDLDLVPGIQSASFELAPACTLHFEFRVDGAALPHDDGIFTGLSRGIRPVDHDGRVQAIRYWLLEATAPGLYDISFEGIGADRFHPIPPRRVDVREGETTEVIVDLHRK